MNKIFSMLILFLLSACTREFIRNDASIMFVDKQHDFGKISYTSESSYFFKFTNPGKTPLIINEVKTSCGCTIPNWPNVPINPGASGVIIIKYDATFPGIFHKTIEVYYNGPTSPYKLEIKGEVEYPKEKIERN